jgi:hypothetical protein
MLKILSTNTTLSTIEMITLVGGIGAGSLASPMLAEEGQSTNPKKLLNVIIHLATLMIIT